MKSQNPSNHRAVCGPSDPYFKHDTYLSPFTWRYGSGEMRAIWSEAHKRRLWRRIWVALAAAQHQAGLVTAALGCLVLLMAYLIVNDKLGDKRDYIRFLDGQIARMEQPAQLIKEKKVRVDAISSQLSRENSALEVLGKIHEVAPEGLVIDDVRFVRDVEVSITGQCYDRPIAFALAERLRNSGVEALARAEVGNTRDERVEGVVVIRFDVRAPTAGTVSVTEELEGSEIEE